MEIRAKTSRALSEASSRLSSKQALVGLDGFVDKIIHPVAQRHGIGDAFTPIKTIEAFGQRILAAAGKSTNIELYPVMEKLGGNGPIMANALVSGGMKVKYVGALGQPQIEEVFADLAKKTDAVSIVAPGVTNALEFEDGKLMLGTMASLDELTWDRLLEVMGEGALHDAVNRADLVALVNWTMLPHMTSILAAMLEKVLPHLGPRESGRTFFFDLADPEKRSPGDLVSALRTIARYRHYGRTILGLNYKEAVQVSKVLELPERSDDGEELKRMATEIRRELDISCVVVHPTRSAACATKEDAWWVEGPYCEKPKITTGAGDHFNAGFATAMTLGLAPEMALLTAVSYSGYYVRNAQSPRLSDVETFLSNWTS